MPDIGATLREARMRQRIDISEIEASTKIRAKYLRALENEEWDLLPGPTFVKSFLRTYADALGLDGRMLIEEFKLEHERLSDVDLQPIAPLGQRERQRRPKPPVPRVAIIGAVVAALIVALYVIGGRSGGDNGDTPDPGTATTQQDTTTAEPASPATSRPSSRTRFARLTVIATGQVSVCLTAAGGRTLVPGTILTGGARKGPYRSSRFRVVFGNGDARFVVNGTQRREVPTVTGGAGYEITRTRVRRLAKSQWPTCR
jgi:cytoskeleton protein RodZ